MGQGKQGRIDEIAAGGALFGKPQEQGLYLRRHCCHLLPQVRDLAIPGSIFRFELGDAFLISQALILPEQAILT